MSKIILLYMKRIQIYHADLPISASHQCRHAIIYFHIAKNRAAIHSSVLKSCGRWDLNPHKRNAYKILSLARLPVPTLPHKRLFSIARRLYYYTFRKKATTIFAFFHLFCSFANCFDFVLSFFHLDWQYRAKLLTRVRNRTTL